MDSITEIWLQMFKSLLSKQDNSIFSSFLLQKKGIILFSVLLLPFLARAQRDVIVTQANEEIRCRILDETPTRFIYAYIGPKGRILRNEIFKNLVKDFKYNKFDSDLVQHSAKDKKEDAEFRSRNSEPSVKDIVASEQAADQKKKESDKAKSPATASSKSANEDIALKSSSQNTSSENPEEVVKTSGTSEESAKQKTISRSKKPEKENTEIDQSMAVKVSDEANKTDASPRGDLNAKPTGNEVKPQSQKEPGMADASSANRNLTNNSRAGSSQAESGIRPSSLPADVEVLTPKANSEKSEIPEVKSDAKALSPTELTNKEETSMPASPLKWRVGIKGGIGNIRDNGFNASDAFGLYQEKLMKGFTLGGDMAFFPLKNLGFGAIFTDFKSKNQADNLNFINPSTGSEVSGSISNSISRKFIGPALLFRKSIDFKTYLVFMASPGMYFYSDKGDYNGEFFDYRGKQFGGASTLGIDFLLGNDIIGRDIILSLEAGYNYGRLSQMDYNNGIGPVTLASPLVMDRLDFSIGLRFMRFPKYLKNSAY